MIEARPAGPADADEIMRLRGVMIGSMTGGHPVTGDWQQAGADVVRRLLTGPDPAVAAFVVDRPDGDGLAACVVGQIDQRLPGPRDPTGLRGYVYNVATDAAYRRRGYSRACMRALLDWFGTRGVGTVDLRASADGEPLYASLGFVRTPDPAMRRVAP
ncbi:GNAT family N-acetyltransferase [Jidongwangia harbinensis]|uniref:GNAT family N-acetyltransferase n=1 Tax=Jidongwangia harbinensis TaxID=2878561 RepID=UPI001CDA3A00|nr:GNAT family N-acetyltransferase [Jidongwangia harbinensis]MCA2214674.1 GNAT family N-acetyltransferase [Jidongwangia harbinensis]